MVTYATRTPVRSSTALVASVVAWTTLVTDAGGTPARPRARAMPSSIPSVGSSCVLRTFATVTVRPLTTTSVKVPPTSTPMA